MKTVFTLRKVVDPHSNMPEEIKKAFFDGTHSWEKNNDSYVDWEVGSYQEPYVRTGADLPDPEDLLLKKVDDWMLKNFTEGEEIIILHWW